MTMPIPDGSVVITPAQMYGEIQETRKSVDRLVATVDPSLSDIRSDVDQHRHDIDKLFESRNRAREQLTAINTKLNAAWAFIGLICTVAGVVTAIVIR